MEGDFSTISIAVGAVGIAMTHAALPTHWLPFVLVGRARGWSRRKVLAVALAAGAGHVTITVAIGILGAVLGAGVAEVAENVGEPVSAAILIMTGVILVLREVMGEGHHHTHEAGPTDKATVLSLFLMLAVSPCEAMLPVFFAAGGKGIWVIVILSGITIVGTLAGMLVLILLTLAGLRFARFEFFERNECKVMGGLLIAMGLIVGGMWVF